MLKFDILPYYKHKKNWSVDYGLMKTKESVKRLQACTKRISILSRMTYLCDISIFVHIYPFLTNLLHLHELWNIMFESQGEGRERGFQQRVCATITKVERGRLPYVAFEYRMSQKKFNAFGGLLRTRYGVNVQN